MTKFSKLIANIAIFIAAIFPAIAQQTTTPQSKVEAFHATLIGVMKQAKTLSVKDRFKLLKPSVENSFDFKLMIALAKRLLGHSSQPSHSSDLNSRFDLLVFDPVASTRLARAKPSDWQIGRQTYPCQRSSRAQRARYSL